MMPYITLTEAEILYADRTRRTAMHHWSAYPELRPTPLRRRIASAMRRTLSLAF
jgi:hypothetical protein